MADQNNRDNGNSGERGFSSMDDKPDTTPSPSAGDKAAHEKGAEYLFDAQDQEGTKKTNREDESSENKASHSSGSDSMSGTDSDMSSDSSNRWASDAESG